MKYTSLLLFIASSACGQASNNKGESRNLTFNRFPQEQRVELQKISSLPHTLAFNLFEHDNRLYFNSFETGQRLLYVYDLQQRALVDSMFRRGTNECEALLPFSAGILPNQIVWFFDPMLARVTRQQLMSDNRQQKANMCKQYELPQGYKYLQLADTNTAYAVKDIQMKGKISRINFQTGAETPLFGTFQNKPAGLSEAAWHNANTGALHFSPSKQIAVLAKTSLDEIEIFDLRHETSITVKGPEQLKPSFKQISTPDGDFLDLTKENRRAYLLSGQLTDHYIYLLYSTAFEMTDGVDYGNIIHVFDYNGNPVKKITLSAKISAFYISEKAKSIYSISPVDGTISKGAL
ncbi:MAG: TolB-like 6-bladed beta-propeller domain-containing protein [Chitinophagaceae bacterium]|nr:TolB-like 6-bladed beta-propeller domain-containing protein [Chitinophagaceae bacterium]